VVYGVGNIGYEVVKIARGLEMNVFGVDIVERHQDVKYLSAQDAAEYADIIVCAMNLTAENINYFNKDYFEKVKPHTIFVNISRGEISPSADVLYALKNRMIAGAALDVFIDESKLSVGLRSGLISSARQVRAVETMLSMDNVILTPHNAFNTQEAVERKCSQTMEQLSHYIENKKLKWPVDE
jgi:D-lactate dehydrogenase